VFGLASIEAFSRGLNWLSFALAGLLLPAEQFGIYAVAVASLLIFSALCVSGQDRVILRYLNTKQNITQASIMICLIGTIFFSLLVFLFIKLSLFKLSISPILLIVWIFVTAQLILLTAIARSLEDKKVFFILRAVFTLGKIIGLVTIAKLFPLASNVILFECLLSLIICIIGFISFKSTIKASSRMEELKHATKYGFPFILHVAAGASLGHIDKLMLSNIASAEAIAQYAFLNSIAGGVFFIFAVLNVKYETSIYKETQYKAADSRLIKLTKISIIAALGVLAAVNFVLPTMLTLIGKAHLFDSMVLLILSVAYLIYPFYLQANIRLSWLEKPKLIPVLTILSATVNIALNLYLIPKYGVLGAAYSTLVSYILLSGAAHFISRKSAV